MLTKDNVERAKLEAKNFLAAVAAMEHQLQSPKNEVQEYVGNGNVSGKYTAAVKRSSMGLSRALAEVRRSPCSTPR